MNSPNFHNTDERTVANSPRLFLQEGESQHFPQEGLYFGELSGGSAPFPALFDLNEGKGLCFLYSDSNAREAANRCLERMAWRLALCVPSCLCDMIFFNGGRPGDAFDTLSRLDKHLFGGRPETAYFDGNLPAFTKLLEEIYLSIAERMSAIRIEGKNNLYELNQALGPEAGYKYQFILLTDFPRNLTSRAGTLLSKIIEAGSRAGIYVMMSWDVKGDFIGNAPSSGDFNAQQTISSMEVILPKNGRYYFKNSPNDALFNRLQLSLDDAPVDHVTALDLLDKIGTLVKKALNERKPKILKQDFARLKDAPYEPALKDIAVTVGLDTHDKHAVSCRFNSKDFIHGFILGQSGSGKSVLLNDIITSAILKYAPQDLMLYLMDFKGVEFNSYRGVKHTKAVLVDSSDPQMTLEVLRELYEEDKRRRKLWVGERVKSIDGYNEKYPDDRLPHILFVADECQVMFKQPSYDSERVILREISEILVHIAKIGRSQGIHMLLATQQLGEINIHNDILENLTECFILRCAARDSERLVPGSGDITGMQPTGIACYYHQKKLVGQVQTFYATDAELATAVADAQQKAGSLAGNGAHYFSGSAEFTLSDATERALVLAQETDIPTAFIGRNIGMRGDLTAIPLGRDFSENILFFGSNKNGQTAGVAVSALQTLLLSCDKLGLKAAVKVIDCYGTHGADYRNSLEDMQRDGLCEIVERTESGVLLKRLSSDIHNQTASPTILVILGNERFAEMKRNTPLGTGSNCQKGSFDISTGVVSMDFFCDENGNTDGYQDQIKAEADRLAMNLDSVGEDTGARTFPEALRYILDEGPMQDVHVLLQVDKPASILFEDYPDQTVSMFKHKVILKSENKYLTPLRLSVDIDVENLCDEHERLRAYYYPENGTPQLFTPYQLTKE